MVGWSSIESLERRALLAGSISATFDGLSAPVIAIKFLQPSIKGVQHETFTLGSSPNIPALFADASTGNPIKSVVITLAGFGKKSLTPITLTDAVISSFQAVGGSNQTLTYLITVQARSKPAGSITATFDGRSAPLLDVTLTQAAPNGPLKVGMTLNPSPVSPVLSHDAVSGKVVKKFQLTFVKLGNHSTGTITLTNAPVTSFQTTGGTGKAVTNTVTLID